MQKKLAFFFVKKKIDLIFRKSSQKYPNILQL